MSASVRRKRFRFVRSYSGARATIFDSYEAAAVLAEGGFYHKELSA